MFIEQGNFGANPDRMNWSQHFICLAPLLFLTLDVSAIAGPESYQWFWPMCSQHLTALCLRFSAPELLGSCRMPLAYCSLPPRNAEEEIALGQPTSTKGKKSLASPITGRQFLQASLESSIILPTPVTLTAHSCVGFHSSSNYLIIECKL